MSGGLALVWPERFLDSVWVADDRMIVMGITVSLSLRMTKAAGVREQAYAAKLLATQRLFPLPDVLRVRYLCQMGDGIRFNCLCYCIRLSSGSSLSEGCESHVFCI
jgi:hypothetical protein